jgi:hypothetical protein
MFGGQNGAKILSDSVPIRKPARRQGNRRSRQSRRSGSCACRQSVRRPPVQRSHGNIRRDLSHHRPSASVETVFIASVFWTNEAAATL